MLVIPQRTRFVTVMAVRAYVVHSCCGVWRLSAHLM